MSEKKVVSEVDLENLDTKLFHEVLLVQSPSDQAGIAVYQTPRIAQFVSPNVESKVTQTNYLLVVVPDPDDLETQKRILSKVLAARAN
ncbi:hypothetical protein AHFPHNDE_01131 [Pseudomonas sp. MM227]|uniref:hypothetical protein n=1 Tax=Pseudomonas sp. MM227 TaxID=3019968 RepID=UPI00221EB1B7|nr:hypothetical protein [Pseudomonas sp. MM227]CAI3787467.1 hypothetical protein AHFPHNDE_01131 [Pseudomonas sp. MM227]